MNKTSMAGVQPKLHPEQGPDASITSLTLGLKTTPDEHQAHIRE